MAQERYDIDLENAPLEEDIRGLVHDYENPETEMFTDGQMDGGDTIIRPILQWEYKNMTESESDGMTESKASNLCLLIDLLMLFVPQATMKFQ